MPRDKITFPPLHLKLGIMTQFVHGLNESIACSTYTREAFPTTNDEKIKAGVFDGPQIRQLMRENSFQDPMNDRKKEV